MAVRYEILKYNKIRDLRNDNDLSQELVAKHLNIAQNTLSQYEIGLRNIPNDTLVKLALLYNTSTDYLLGLTDDPRPYRRKK